MLVHDQGIELLYCPCYTVPLVVRCRTVVSVHDLIAMTHPRLAGWPNALHLRMLVGPSVHRADAICVPTEFVRRSLVDRFAVPADKVFVVPWGVDDGIVSLPPEDAAREVRRRFGVDAPFVLFCGCVEAKKNLRAAMRASAEAGLLLLIVGPWISSSATVLSSAARAADGRWRYLGYVSTSDLSALYSAATALVFPSYTEGFGLPTIEAMRCGCPVITSDAPALLEVCGGAAIHVPPQDTSAVVASLRAVVTDRSFRENLAGRGTAHAASFTWATTVDRFTEAIDYAERPARLAPRPAPGRVGPPAR
jgi:glycosyltransferase involved in cell wall biosynthesis